MALFFGDSFALFMPHGWFGYLATIHAIIAAWDHENFVKRMPPDEAYSVIGGIVQVLLAAIILKSYIQPGWLVIIIFRLGLY